MNRAIHAISVAALLALGGCGKKSDNAAGGSGSAAAPAGSGSAMAAAGSGSAMAAAGSGGSAAAAGSAAGSGSAAAAKVDVPTEVDFESDAKAKITDKNVDVEVKAIEKDLDTTGK